MHNKTTSLLGTTAFALVVGLGCGGGGGGESGISAQKACDHAAKARCDRAMRCFEGHIIKLDYGAEARCLAEQTKVCLDELSLPKTGDTPKRQEECAVAIDKQTCEDWGRGLPVPGCANAVGKQPLDAPCISSSQCETTLCALPPGQACGTCKPRLKAGETGCDMGLGCEAGARCASNVCYATVPENGGACGATALCEGRLDCIAVDPVTMTGKCALRPQRLGDPCNRSRATLPRCDEARTGLYCDTAPGSPTLNTCVRPGLAEAGQPCGEMRPARVTVGCTADALCSRPPDLLTMVVPDMGTCVAPVGIGMPCDTTLGPDCVRGSVCADFMPGATKGTCKDRGTPAAAKACGVM